MRDGGHSPFWALFAFVAGSLAVPASAASYEVDAREPMALVLSTPTGRQAQVSSSEIIRQIDAGLRRNTGFSLRTLPADIVKTCRGRLGCLTLKSRPDYDPAMLARAEGRPLPYREYVRRLKSEGTVYTRYLLVVSNVTLPGRADRLSAVLVDTDVALQLFQESRRDQPDWEDRFEARVDAGAAAGAAATGAVRTASDVARFFEKFLRENVRQRLVRTGHWRPFGQVRIETKVPYLAVLWDGRTVGSTSKTGTQLTQARAGRHTLTLKHPDYAPITREVQVVAGEVATVRVSPQRKPGTEPLERHVLLWTGVGLVVASGALGAYALAQDGDTVTACVGGTCPEGSGFRTFGYSPDAGTTEEINPDGILVGPLGYSLAATGAVWSLGTLLSDEDDSLWWPLLIGLAVGSASYGLSVALDGP